VSFTRGEGTITWSDLDVHLHDKRVRSLFKKIDLEPWHLKNFFDLIGANDDESETGIDIDQFIRGCFRLRCSVKNIDFAASRHDEAEYLGKRLNEIKECLKQVQNAVVQSQAPLLRIDQQSGDALRSHWNSLVCCSV